MTHIVSFLESNIHWQNPAQNWELAGGSKGKSEPLYRLLWEWAVWSGEEIGGPQKRSYG